MKERSGAKKLYKANKAWVAAGLAAATLFSVSALGGNTVSAATATDGSAETQSATKTISFDFIDQDTKEVVGPTVSVTVPEHTGLTYAQLAKYLPAGYTSDFLGAYSTTTKKYYISVKKTAETKTAVGNPTAVNKEAYYDNTKKAEVGNPTAINKEAYYDNTKKAEVGNPTAINKEAYYDNTPKFESKVDEPVSVTKDQLTKAGYDANGLAVTNKSTVAKTTPLANKTTGATKAATKATLPKTGDNNNVVAAGVGAVAVLGALFGLAGDRRKRA